MAFHLLDSSYCSLPASFPDEQAAPLLCAGVIGLRALRLAGALDGGTLGIFGFGASAHVAIQVARYRGCDVLVLTRAEHHRRHALALGASWAGPARAGASRPRSITPSSSHRRAIRFPSRSRSWRRAALWRAPA